MPEPSVDAVGPRLLVESLERIGVTLAAYLPDEWLEPLIAEVERTPRVRGVRVAREDEGIGICAGAFFGGQRAVLITQNSGILPENRPPMPMQQRARFLRAMGLER